MTIAQAIEKVQSLKPSQYTTADMVGWLAQQDGQIDVEVIRTHEGAPDTEFEPYDPEGNYDNPEGEAYLGDTVLLIPFPYDNAYIDLLSSRIDWYNREYSAYNNTRAAWDASYAAFLAFYNREHLPKAGPSITVGTASEDDILPAELT
jgi:hypothetical protein